MKKLLAFLYGVAAYLIFLVAFLYAVGFVGNFIVPKSIDSGTETTFGQALLVDELLLGLFAIQHSVMARPAFKQWWTRIISPVIERSTYVLLASLALMLLLWKWQPMPSIVWKVENQVVSKLLIGISFSGWLVVLLSTFMINHFDLFGLRQVFDNLTDKRDQGVKFKTNLFYTIVRHPIMLGFLIAFWSTPVMTLGHLVFSLTTTAYILVAVKFLEERDLRKAFGKEYEDYQRSVPMLIPFIGKRSNKIAHPKAEFIK
jgi:methanethiol S-methyltransferase